MKEVKEKIKTKELSYDGKTITLYEEMLHKDLISSVQKNGYINNKFVPIRCPVKLRNKSLNNAEVNYYYKERFTAYTEYIKKDNFDRAMWCFPKGYHMLEFYENRELIYEKLGEEKYYTFLRNKLVYLRCQYHCRHLYKELIYLGTDYKLMMTEEEKKKLQELPETFTIYRGVGDNFNHNDLKKLVGNSWTLSVDTALDYSKPGNEILKLNINKSEVLGYFNNYSEKEIFVDYEAISLKRIEIVDIRKLK